MGWPGASVRALEWHVFLEVDVAAVRGQLTIHELHEGGLARAVAATETDALPLFQVDVDAVEEGRATEAEAHVADTEEGHGRCYLALSAM